MQGTTSFSRSGTTVRPMVFRSMPRPAEELGPVRRTPWRELPPPLRAGYGRCGVPGCPCQGFQGTGMACNNCGHQFGQHLG